MDMVKINPSVRYRIGQMIRFFASFLATFLEKLVYGIGKQFYTKRKRDLSQCDGTVRKRTVSEDDELLKMVFPQNLFDVLTFGKDVSDNGRCVGYRPFVGSPYVYFSYGELIERSKNFGAGLLTIGGKSDCEYLIGLFAKSCVEWTVVEYGCLGYGMVTAPLYESLGHQTCQQMIDFYEIEVIVCGGEVQVKALLGDDHTFPSCLRTIITIDPLADSRVVEMESLGVKVLTIQQVEDLGRLNPHPLCPSGPDKLATLIFTSGTTGMAKGVMLTHSELILALKSLCKTFLPIRFGPEDALLGYLPLAHIFERLLEKIIHLNGGHVGYLSGDVSNLFKDARDVKPTLFGFVPRLMNRLHDQIQVDLGKSYLHDLLAKIGVVMKKWEMERGIFRKDSFWDRLIFRRYQAMLGGNLRTGIVGSASTDGNILNFIRAVFGCYIFEMYGQTEASGPITATAYGDLSADHVGIPFYNVEIKLVDVPDMGYSASKGTGEVCVRSKFNMRGYYKMPEKTAETLDDDDWLHTGDIGMWLPSGNLKIFDRMKHIFKLSQGEYLAPERLEGLFVRSELIHNIFMEGDSKYPFPVAVVYPNYEAFSSSDKDNKQVVKKLILEELVRHGKASGLKSYEIPKNIHILDEAFSVENDCVTPSQKTRREIVRKLHKDKFAKLYEEAEGEVSASCGTAVEDGRNGITKKVA